MSKLSELDMVLSELKNCGKALMNIANSLTEIFTNKDEESEIQQEKEKPEYSFLDVRSKCTEISRNGHKEKLKELMKKYGADKLSSINPAQYAALMTDLEAIK